MAKALQRANGTGSVYKLSGKRRNPWRAIITTLASISSVRTVEAAYNYCTPLYKMRMKDIRVEHLEGTIRDATVGSATKGRIKSLFNMMYRCAMKHEIVQKDYAQLCNAVKREAPEKEVIPFSPEKSLSYGIISTRFLLPI